MTTIRQLLPDDIAAADAVLRAAHRVSISYERLLRMNRKLTPEHWWVLEDAGTVIGVVGSTSYGSFAHVGLMAIDPGVQLGGTGRELLLHAIGQLEAAGFESITLYSTDPGLAFYSQLGFRWAGISTEWVLRKRKPRRRAIPVTATTDVARIAEWDRGIFGGNRQALLEALAAEGPGRVLVAGDMRGFAVAQPVVVGPIAAESAEVAADLVDAALELQYSDTPRVILPDANGGAEAMLIEVGFTPLRTSRYFIRGKSPQQRRDCLFGQTAYSLG